MPNQTKRLTRLRVAACQIHYSSAGVKYGRHQRLYNTRVDLPGMVNHFRRTISIQPNEANRQWGKGLFCFIVYWLTQVVSDKETSPWSIPTPSLYCIYDSHFDEVKSILIVESALQRRPCSTTYCQLEFFVFPWTSDSFPFVHSYGRHFCPAFMSAFMRRRSSGLLRFCKSLPVAITLVPDSCRYIARNPWR